MSCLYRASQFKKPHLVVMTSLGDGKKRYFHFIDKQAEIESMNYFSEVTSWKN